MKTNLHENPPSHQIAPYDRPPNYQVFRQARNGRYMAEFQTDSALEAVEFFLIASPAFEGGEIRLWDERLQRTGAQVAWKKAPTEIGLTVFRRTDVFNDTTLAALAREAKAKQKLREEIVHSVRMSA